MYRKITCSMLSEAEMEAELAAHFAEVDAKIEAFMRRRSGILEMEGCHIEHYSIERMIWEYIKWFNDNVREYGNGFETDWDSDGSLQILYRDGSTRYISETWDDGTKRIKLDGIHSIIYDAGWGSAYAGKCINIYNMREAVGYGRYGYRDIEQRYNDFDDIRVEFNI